MDVLTIMLLHTYILWNRLKSLVQLSGMIKGVFTTKYLYNLKKIGKFRKQDSEKD